MTKFLFIFLFFLSTVVSAQRFDGYVISNENDTINCSFDVQTNLFDETMFYPTSVLKSVKIITEKGEKVKYHPNQLKAFLIKNTKFGDYRFVSIDADKHKNFYQEVTIGKISLYRSYVNNMQPGAFPIEKTFYCKDNGLSSKETNFFNFRNWFGKFIEDYPELHQKWMDSDNYYKKNQVADVVKLYNEHFK